MAKRRRSISLLVGTALGLLMVVFVAGPVQADPSTDGWTSDPSFTITLLGRDGPNNTDHYLVTMGFGGTFFAVASETMPLVPTDQAVNIVLDGYKRTFPGRPQEAVQPGDDFDFFVPAGTPVATKWRQLQGNSVEYQSLQGDDLITYSDPKSPILYQLRRGGNLNQAEVKINLQADLKPDSLAQALYSQGAPNFRPDFLQLTRATDIIKNSTDTVTIDLTTKHLDDLQDLKGSALSGGKTDSGMDIYLFPAGDQAQSLFRIDDAVGDQTDLSGMPTVIRVYYYKDGTIRTYQLSSDTVLLSSRQPPNAAWAKVYQDYGKLNPAPSQWDIGQPEQSAQAQELAKLGVAALRYDVKPRPQGNFFTQLLDMVLGLMNRKQS